MEWATPWEVEQPVELSTYQKSVLIGTLLGDGHLERDGRHVRLKIDHAWTQAAYVWWKFRVFQDWTLREPQRRLVYDKRNGGLSIHCRFVTRTLPELEEYYQLFYVNKRKVVPQGIQRLLHSSLALAVWYMDDGARRTDCQALRVHTNAYTLEEQYLLCETLVNNFGVSARVHRVRANEYVLYIPACQAKTFCDLIRPYVLPELYHKLL